MTAELTIAGQTLRLFADRALLWVETRTLILADPHFGKDAAFRHAGIPVPQATLQSGLDRLGNLVRFSECARLVILGDFFHARDGRTSDVIAAFSDWRAGRANLPITLIRGNHDRSAGDPPPAWGIDVHAAPLHEPPFVFYHEPPAASPPDDRFALCGHLHPAASLVDRAGIPQRLACFHFRLRERVGVLPAFGRFTGVRSVRPSSDDRVFATADGEVFEV